jgi:hypothetical protein
MLKTLAALGCFVAVMVSSHCDAIASRIESEVSFPLRAESVSVFECAVEIDRFAPRLNFREVLSGYRRVDIRDVTRFLGVLGATRAAIRPNKVWQADGIRESINGCIHADAEFIRGGLSVVFDLETRFNFGFGAISVDAFPQYANVGPQLPSGSASAQLDLYSADYEQQQGKEGQGVAPETPQPSDNVVDAGARWLAIVLGISGAGLIGGAWRLASWRPRIALCVFGLGAFGLWLGIVGLRASLWS